MCSVGCIFGLLCTSVSFLVGAASAPSSVSRMRGWVSPGVVEWWKSCWEQPKNSSRNSTELAPVQA
jgi:hypothetical protein